MDTDGHGYTLKVRDCRQRQRHQAAEFYPAGAVLARADRPWLSRLITRRERPENLSQA